jgi:hypothetical protein
MINIIRHFIGGPYFIHAWQGKIFARGWREFSPTAAVSAQPVILHAAAAQAPMPQSGAGMICCTGSGRTTGIIAVKNISQPDKTARPKLLSLKMIGVATRRGGFCTSLETKSHGPA